MMQFGFYGHNELLKMFVIVLDNAEKLKNTKNSNAQIELLQLKFLDIYRTFIDYFTTYRLSNVIKLITAEIQRQRGKVRDSVIYKKTDEILYKKVCFNAYYQFKF